MSATEPHWRGLNFEVTDWPRFNWTAYRDSTASALSKLHDKWIGCGDDNVDTLVQELTSCIQECVDKIATTRTIILDTPNLGLLQRFQRDARNYACLEGSVGIIKVLLMCLLTKSS